MNNFIAKPEDVIMNISGYHINKVIGQGNTATVYHAEHILLKQERALKVMSAELTTQPGFKENFIREGQIITALKHPNIITIYDIGACNDCYFMAMEYQQGGNLEELLKSSSLSLSKAQHILEQIGSALHHAHQQQLIHRDIKPSNIVFDAEENAILTDFGISKLQHTTGDLTKAGYNLLGTPNYMSPEQIGEKTIDHRSDLYSLALVFYEMLSGKKAVQATNITDAINEHLLAPPPRLPIAFAFLQPVLNKALAKTVDERYADILAFIDAVKATQDVDDQTLIMKKAVVPRHTVLEKKTKTAFLFLENLLIYLSVPILIFFVLFGAFIVISLKLEHLPEQAIPAVTNVEKASNINTEKKFHIGCVSDQNCEDNTAFTPDISAKEKPKLASKKKADLNTITNEKTEPYHKVAEQGDAEGQANLGAMYDTGRGVTQSDNKASEWYRKAAEQGNAEGQANLGFMYDTGRGVKQSDSKAVEWYRKAAEQGNAFGQYSLGYLYEKGRGVTQSYNTAVKWYRKAAEQGNALGQYNLGVMYEKGQGVQQNNNEAVEWYRKSAEQGFALGQANLGIMYEKGLGIEQNNDEAITWQHKSAELGNALRQANLETYSDEIDSRTIKWYRKAAEQGEPIGQNILGVLYQKGQGVEKNNTKAIKWYRKAAKQGNTQAQNNLGSIYENGEGVIQSDDNATKWYRKAAEQGDALGQYNLGFMYEKGRGITQNYNKAFKWYLKSAEQGYAVEQGYIHILEKLSIMYKKGRGTKKNPSEAEKWYQEYIKYSDDQP